MGGGIDLGLRRTSSWSPSARLRCVVALTPLVGLMIDVGPTASSVLNTLRSLYRSWNVTAWSRASLTSSRASPATTGLAWRPCQGGR